MSGCVHGRSWILSGVLDLKIFTLTRNVRTIKRIPPSDTLWGERKGGGGGKGEGEGRRKGEVKEGEEEGRHDSGRIYSAATDTHESVTFEVNLIIRHGSAYLSWNSCTHTI